MRLSGLGGLALGAVALRQRGVVERGDGDDDIHDDHEEALEVVALLVAQEVADRDDGEDQHDEVEHVKVEPHVELHAVGAHAPPDNNNKGPVEEGRLQRGAQHVRQRKVHLVVPRLVDGGDMLGGLFDERHEDQAHKRVRDAVVLDDGGDFLDQGHGDEADQCDPAAWTLATSGSPSRRACKLLGYSVLVGSVYMLEPRGILVQTGGYTYDMTSAITHSVSVSFALWASLWASWSRSSSYSNTAS